MSSNQQRLSDFLDNTVQRVRGFDAIAAVRDRITDIADTIGIRPGEFGSGPEALDDQQGVYRTQFVKRYWFERTSGNESLYPVEFRSVIYTTKPPSPELQRYLRTTHNPRLRTLFNTGTYSGYMDGFEFLDSDSATEGPTVVARDEVPPSGLGVPQWTVKVYYDDDEPAGEAYGFSLDFSVDETITSTPDPGQEVWRVRSYNTARGDYEVGPGGGDQRRRTKNIQGKDVYVNGQRIGKITQRGTAWMTKEHDNPNLARTASREDIIDAGTPYQAVSTGAKLYKVREDSDRIVLSTAQPQGFDPTDPDKIDPGATARRQVERTLELQTDSDPTEFVVTEDVANANPGYGPLGKYQPIVRREIATGSDFSTHGSMYGLPDAQFDMSEGPPGGN